MKTKLILDVNKTQYAQLNSIVTGRVGDKVSNVVDVYVIDGGIPYNLTGLNVFFECAKPDNTVIRDNNGVKMIDAAKGYFEYTFPPETFGAVGKAKQAFMSIEKDKAIRATTQDFVLVTLPDATTNRIPSESYFSDLEKLIQELNEMALEEINSQAAADASAAKDFANQANELSISIQKQLNEIVISGDSSVEAAQAREDALGVTYPVLKERVDAEQLRILNEVKRAVAQSFNIESQTSQVYDDSKIFAYLEGITKKTYVTNTLNSSGITKVNNGNRSIRISPTLTNYIYSDKHLKFNDGYPLTNKSNITHEIATVNTSNHIDGSLITLNDQFSILFTGIKPQFSSTDAYGVKYLANIYNADTEMRIRFDQSKNGLNLELRKNNVVVGNVDIPFSFVIGDSLNILITQRDYIEITICVNKDKSKIYIGKLTQTVTRNDYTIIPLDYQMSNLNLQASSSYDSILVFSKKFEENKAIVIEQNYYNHDITYRQQILSGTGNTSDWNEKIPGEVSNILHDPLDVDRPYKIAVGGYNGNYTEQLVGKTGFAYSKDLINWTYVNGGKYCIDQYSEDGCLIKFRGKYYYYAEGMPNRNVLLYTSFDFVNWTYEGIVASPDLDPSLVNRPSSEVSSGSPSAIVRNGKVYLFIEYGYTSNTGHSNRVLVSVDGVNFRKLSTVPDLFKREFCRPVLDPTIWTINNLEGICEVNGVYYAWLSITNKTQSPTIFSMWEVTSVDLITWKFTGANFSSNAGDFISFACLSDSNQIVTNGRYTSTNAVEILFLSREEQKLPDEFKKATVNVVKDPYFKDIKSSQINNAWFYTKNLPIVSSGGKLTYYKPEVNQGIVQFITGIKPNTLYKLTIKTNGRFVMNGYQDNTSNKVESDFLQFINEVDGSVIFKTGPLTNILSCAWTGFLNCSPILELSNVVIEEV